ncbi:MAG: porin family protein [Bacteroidota bacterium]
MNSPLPTPFGLRLLSAILFLLLLQPAIAQRFSAGPIVGLNAAQIDGDRSAGYNKLGLSAGVRATAYITDRTDLSIELLYSQKGSQSELSLGSTFIPFKIRINYVEVPVLYNYKDWLYGDDDEAYYKVQISGGFSYARLLNTEIEDEAPNSDLVALGDFFRRNDVSIVIGASFFATRNIGFSVRWSRSLTPIFKPDDTTPNARTMISKYLTFQTMYMF